LASSPRPAADQSDALPWVAAFRRSSVRRTASLRFLPVSQYSKESLVLLSAPDVYSERGKIYKPSVGDAATGLSSPHTQINPAMTKRSHMKNIAFVNPRGMSRSGFSTLLFRALSAAMCWLVTGTSR